MLILRESKLESFKNKQLLFCIDSMRESAGILEPDDGVRVGRVGDVLELRHELGPGGQLHQVGGGPEPALVHQLPLHPLEDAPVPGGGERAAGLPHGEGGQVGAGKVGELGRVQGGGGATAEAKGGLLGHGVLLVAEGVNLRGKYSPMYARA